MVLGPNGAGKTTLLQLASAQMHPSDGVAAVLEEVLGTVDVFELRPRIGLTSAALAERIPRHERVRDVVVSASYGVVGRWREDYDGLDHARAEALLRELGALHLADRTFGTLSEGERKRVQIARALMTDPEMLLLDEPAAGLDLGGREDLVSTLSVLAHDPDSPATVLVSHHVEEIPPGFTHALLLREGRVVDAGPLEEVLTERALSATFGMPLASPTSTSAGTARDAPAPTTSRSPGAPGRVGDMDWISEHLWAAWLGVAVALGVAEMFSLDLICMMLAVGALAGMVGALVGCPCRRAGRSPPRSRRWRCSPAPPRLVERLHGGPELALGHGKLVGTPGHGHRAHRRPRRSVAIRLGGRGVDRRAVRRAPDRSSRARPSRCSRSGVPPAYVHPVPTLEP